MLPPASVQWVGEGKIFCAINTFNRFATAIKKTDSLFHVLLIVLSNMKCMLGRKTKYFLQKPDKEKGVQ